MHGCTDVSASEYARYDLKFVHSVRRVSSTAECIFKNSWEANDYTSMI